MAKVHTGIDKLIIIGGSAGSLEPLIGILSALPSGYPHPIVVVLHRKASDDDLLATLLTHKTALEVRAAEDKDALSTLGIFLAPGDYHLLFEADGTMALDESEKIAFSRPSIDVSFQSAAAIYGSSLICILLSGANADGTEGLLEVRKNGGLSISQLPASARVPFMPKHAIDHHAADKVMDIPAIAGFLLDL